MVAGAGPLRRRNFVNYCEVAHCRCRLAVASMKTTAPQKKRIGLFAGRTGSTTLGSSDWVGDWESIDLGKPEPGGRPQLLNSEILQSRKVPRSLTRPRASMVMTVSITTWSSLEMALIS